MKVMILGHMRDLQTGVYVVSSFEELGHEVDFVDIRKILEESGDMISGQKNVLEVIENKNFEADLVIVLKGLELSFQTTEKIKEMFPKATFVNWFFDVYLADKKIWDNEAYYETLKLYDYFFCSLQGVADKLKIYGFDNVVYLPEACFPPSHEEQHINNFQLGKYGSDVAFIGSVGATNIHKNRVEFLSKVAQAGFDLKIWGDFVGNKHKIPTDVIKCATGTQAINEKHSQVCQASLINLGIDQDPTLQKSWSARLYRVLCAGGLYLSTPTRGIQKVFKTNENIDSEITPDQEIVLFFSAEDLIYKLDFLLEHDDIRESIAKNGQKKVLAEHKFTDRIKEMLEVIKK